MLWRWLTSIGLILATVALLAVGNLSDHHSMRAWAQTACTVQSQAVLLMEFNDNTPPASITPQIMRNLICSAVGGPGTGVLIGNAANLSALKNTSISSYTGVIRLGYSTPGDGGWARYLVSPLVCSLNSGNGDNGAQVKPNVGTGCFLLQVPTGALTDIRV